MSIVDQRAALERLIRDRREDYAGLSRLLGRNPAYIQQFIKRGTPRRLDDNDRRTLARYFGVAEQELGGRADEGVRQAARMTSVRRLDVGASAGHGAAADTEAEIARFAFDERWLRQICRGNPAELSMIRVQGDSMSPTLGDGDEILVNAADAADRLRDGIYVLRRDDALMVKRLAVNPFARRVTIKSDNPAYPDWPDCELKDLDIIGRVVWAGRQLS